MNYKIISFGMVLFAIFLIGSVMEAPFVKMTNAKCPSYNKSWVEVHYCRLKAYSRNKTSLNVNATFLHPANNIFLRLKLMKRANGYKPFLWDFTLDACEFMRKRNQPVAKIVWNIIKDVSTVNHTCPYVCLQTVSDFHRVEIPLPMPTGEYLLLMTWIFDGKPQFSTDVYFTFVED
ncbi:GL20426 [Drosophila persimilis]|uniref:GL20426 n=1 Tax=Drosophila persimilis TaxID=7234 RepID=B4H667_DROPE|nr:GL20426 [Drosophila persimilis]